MSDLTTEEKVYLIECFYSRGKVYANACRGFRTKFGQHKVASENTLKRYKKNSYSCSCFVSQIFLTEFHSNAFFLQDY